MTIEELKQKRIRELDEKKYKRLDELLFAVEKQILDEGISIVDSNIDIRIENNPERIAIYVPCHGWFTASNDGGDEGGEIEFYSDNRTFSPVFDSLINALNYEDDHPGIFGCIYHYLKRIFTKGKK